MYFCLFSFFFFNDTATTEIYTLSLHDAMDFTGQLCPSCPRMIDLLASLEEELKPNLIVVGIHNWHYTYDKNFFSTEGMHYESHHRGLVNGYPTEIGRASCRERV